MSDGSWWGVRIGVTIGTETRHLFVRDTGPRTDSATVFLHGFPTSSLDWSKIASRFDDRRALYIDLLGFGHSDKPKIRYSYPLHAELIVALLQSLEVRSYRIVAHDYAVTLAQELLHRERDADGTPQLERVVFLNGGVYAKHHRQQRFHRLMSTPLLSEFVARRITPGRVAAGLNAIAGTRDAWTLADARTHWEAMAARDGLRLLPRLVHYIADRRTDGAVWEAAMESASSRIAFVWGPEDPVSGAHVFAEIRKRLPSVRAIAIAGAGHYPHWEAPGATADAIVECLRAP